MKYLSTIFIKKRFQRVKLFLTDVDGTLTDGGMYYSENGDELKKFNTRDGMGLVMLKERGIKVGIITGEERELNRRRAEKLGIDYYISGKQGPNKLIAVHELIIELGISMNEVAYIGDDINCYELLSAVGFAACPADATKIIKHIPHISRMKNKGGGGCVREFIELLLAAL